MNRLALALAAALACSIGTIPASAQYRDGHRDGVRRDYRGDHRHHHYPRYSYGPRYSYAPRYWGARPYDWYDPFWAYPAPGIVYSYPLYEPAPVIVERVYEPVPVEPPRSYEERTYAQIERPREPAAAPQPQFERYTLSAKELFEFDKAALRKPQPRLDEIARALRANPQIEHVRITGYTDRIGTEPYNLKLSQRRADAVKAYLVAQGVEPHRLSAVGKGEANPLVQCPDAPKDELVKCLEPNRRVEVEQITVERRVR